MAHLPPSDPRLRPFRTAAYGLYLVLVSAFSLVLLVSVLRSLRQMTPPPLPPTAPLTVQECLGKARTLWAELEEHRRGLTSRRPAALADEEWTSFRTRWLGGYRKAEAQCALDARERAPLRRTFGLLVSVQDLYTTHAVQYAGEVGPAVDALQVSLEP